MTMREVMMEQKKFKQRNQNHPETYFMDCLSENMIIFWKIKEPFNQSQSGLKNK